VTTEAERIVRVAARALGHHRLLHAYGHCSRRIDAESFLVAPSKPLGLVRPGEACTVVRLEGPLPEGVLGEVRIHREIYRRRPEVGGVVRSMPSSAMSLAAMGRSPKARHGFGAYFYPGPPLWPSIQLLRSDEQAGALADQLGQGAGILMRGNGAVVAGESLEQAVVLTWYLEDMCRIELDCLAAGSEDPVLTAEEAAARAIWSGGILERMWAWLTDGDPEP
jgi:HCOMODA/2-hydroxy-3-carboxy-muconic semialdehyde decarboxylase